MMSLSRCGECGETPDWRVVRLGDSYITWACFAHLGPVCDSLQRPWEISELLITNQRKLSEWMSIAAALEAVARSA